MKSDHEHLGAGGESEPAAWLASSRHPRSAMRRVPHRKLRDDEGYNDVVNMASRPRTSRRPAPHRTPPEALELGSGRRGSGPPKRAPWLTDRGISRSRRAESRAPAGSHRVHAVVRALIVRPSRVSARGSVAMSLAFWTRDGAWDASQVTTCRCCARWSGTGTVPLLGPPTSIGDVHHGALLLLHPGARGGADRRRLLRRRPC